MTRQISFIINPVSGNRNRGPIRKKRVEEYLERTGIDAAVCETSGPNEAGAIARREIEGGATRLICVGGDGTINEVGREVVGTSCEFALVPMGSGNGLARHLKIPLSFTKAIEFAIKGKAVRIDTGEADGRPFFNVMGMGFDAEIGRRFNETRSRGLVSYLKEGWKAQRTYRSKAYQVDFGSESISLNAYVLAVANSSQYGNNAFIAPDASTLDGKLNLVAISQPSLVSVFVLMWRIFNKKIYLSPRVTQICSESFSIKLGEPGFFHVDGEIFPCGPEIKVNTRPQSLCIVAQS